MPVPEAQHLMAQLAQALQAVNDRERKIREYDALLALKTEQEVVTEGAEVIDYPDPDWEKEDSDVSPAAGADIGDG